MLRSPFHPWNRLTSAASMLDSRNVIVVFFSHCETRKLKLWIFQKVKIRYKSDLSNKVLHPPEWFSWSTRQSIRGIFNLSFYKNAPLWNSRYWRLPCETNMSFTRIITSIYPVIILTSPHIRFWTSLSSTRTLTQWFCTQFSWRMQYNLWPLV